MPTSSAPPNPELNLAAEFVTETGCHLFLTGEAGTGKTTFLKNLNSNCPKRMIVTAPTGVAAINAGGVTLHSFFQLPFGPFVPGTENSRSHFRFSREKKNIIKSLDLLVIDEVSMVRADLLDGVDSVLRRHRRNHQPFGGVQLLMIGDLFQLPPVVTKNEHHLFEAHYPSPYFFSAHVLQKIPLVTIALKQIYRQADLRFVELLNRVRNNRLNEKSLGTLNRRHLPGFNPDEKEGFITLCTHNRVADRINASRLRALRRRSRRFRADIEGEFPDHLFPTAAELKLKPGAQVMFIRNDSAPEKRYFNGKIGTITRLNDDEIGINCPEDKEEITVELVTWENIAYTFDDNSGEITEKCLGRFSQFPLKLAWAITIHKSQGLTFDKAVIDAQAAFAHGQVYVALSRCRTLEGMVLSSPLRAGTVPMDPAILRFTRQSAAKPITAAELKQAKIDYQQQLLLECFNFGRLQSLLRWTVSLLLSNAGVIQVVGIDDVQTFQRHIEETICLVGEKFISQLNGLFSKTQPPAIDPKVLERIGKASDYFKKEIETGIVARLAALEIETDNKAVAKKIATAIQRLREEAAVKLAAVKSCATGFSPTAYFKAVSTAIIETSPPQKRKKRQTIFAETDITFPDFYETLIEWRNRKAEEESIARYQVLHQKTLVQLAIHLPDSLKTLKKIWGIGDRLAARYGEELVTLIAAYRKEHGITEVVPPTPNPVEEKKVKTKAPKIDTKQQSLELFQAGLSIAEIAAQRELTVSTIEGHLAHWVTKGVIPIDQIVSAKKQQTIVPTLTRMADKRLGEIKAKLGDEISYGEIRLVQAYLKYTATLK